MKVTLTLPEAEELLNTLSSYRGRSFVTAMRFTRAGLDASALTAEHERASLLHNTFLGVRIDWNAPEVTFDIALSADDCTLLQKALFTESVHARAHGVECATDSTFYAMHSKVLQSLEST